MAWWIAFLRSPRCVVRSFSLTPGCGSPHAAVGIGRPGRLGFPSIPTTTTTTTTRLFYTPFPENLYREWTLEQDKLLWSHRQKDPGEVAVLLGRGIRGVEKRLEKLGDVESAAYQRLFVGNSEEAAPATTAPTTNTNTPSRNKLPPCSEVLRRIEWDHQLDPKDFRILHYDRVENTIVASPLTAPNLSIDSKETSLVAALPEHRIVSVLYRERVVWDRRNNRKHDVFFGPPGILEVAEAYDDWKAEKDSQTKTRARLRSVWSERWAELLGGESLENLEAWTENLLAQNENKDFEGGAAENHGHASVQPEGMPTLDPEQQKKVDAYLESVLVLFRAVAESTNGDGKNHNAVLVSLLDELSEWIASLCWSRVGYDDIGELYGTTTGAGLLRETLLRKLSSTMDRLEGKSLDSPTTTRKQQQKQKKEQKNQGRKILLDETDLEETFVRGSGAGGQKINKTSNRVVLVHRPTGIRVECQDTRSLKQNRKIARKRLADKLDAHYHGADSKQAQKQQKLSSKKKKTKSKNKARLAAKQEAKRKKKAMQAERDAANDEWYGV